MDEQYLFDRIHGALDVEPRPGAFERLERALARSTVRPRAARGFAGIRLTGGMKLVAAVLAILLLLAAAGAFINLHLVSSVPSPAGPMSVSAYQALTERDLAHWSSVGDATACENLQSVCPAPGAPVRTALQHWLKDLNQSEAPARFTVVDSLLRRHIAANVTDLNGVFAAYAARDENALTRWYFAGGQEASWISDMADSVIRSRPATASLYVASVRSEQANLASCCQSLLGAARVSCSDPTATCEFDAYETLGVIEVFEATVVRNQAPTSLAAFDGRLQRDLALADNTVEAMGVAALAGDQAGFDAARVSLAIAMPRINSDIAQILGQ